MKTLSLKWLASIFIFSMSISVQLQADESKKEWFQGGTLHQATIYEWIEASAENKLATASDWLSATLWKGKLTSPSAFQKLKEKSQMLADAIDHVAQGQELGKTKAIEIAAAIVTTANDLGP